MKLNTGVVIKQLNGKPVMTEQEEVLVAGKVLRSGGRELTVGDVLSTILTTKKVEQFNPLKAYALAQTVYKKDMADVDEGDFQGLREMVEANDQFIPLVLAQVMKVLIDTKEKNELQEKKKK